MQWNEQIPVEEYAKLADQFTLTNFRAAAWVDAAQAAGMKYMVLTSRHHDGFCLFNDEGNEFTTAAAHRDIVKEFAVAVYQAGLRVGLYYSPLDWRFPSYILPDVQRQSAEAMLEQYHRQIKERLSNCGPVDVLWFAGGERDWLCFSGDWKGSEWKRRPKDVHYTGRFDWQHDQVYAMIRQLQPDVVINGRADIPEDFYSREGAGALGGFDGQLPWELCTCNSPRNKWTVVKLVLIIVFLVFKVHR